MLATSRDPIVSIATAPGRGAVGIVRVSGEGLAAFATALLQRSLKPREATYLSFVDAAGQPIDHGLALWFPAPYSYTGEDVLELQGHGGPVVMQLLLARCLQLGQTPGSNGAPPLLPRLRLAHAGEFTERAFLNDKLDLAQAEAVADLIDASTEAAARSASQSLAGAFSERVHALRDALVSLRTLVEATLDFPEEDIDFLKKADATGQLEQLRERLDDVLNKARQGTLLRNGIKVVIAGQPNAGKSSLLNALAGAELAIVTPIPGTTRDLIQQTIQIEGVPLHVVDTAGLRQGAEVNMVERMGIERAWGQIEKADVVIFLRDLSRADQADYQMADAAIASQLPNSVRQLLVWNKCDQCSADAWPMMEQAQAAGELVISARRGDGLPALRQQLLVLAGWQHAGDGLFMARERHLNALYRVDVHLETAEKQLADQAVQLDLVAEELRLAQQSLGEITGEFRAEDMLGEIFSRFCIGK